MKKILFLALLLPILTQAQFLRLTAVADAPPALITITGVYIPFGTTSGSASVSQVVVVGGSRLTANIVFNDTSGKVEISNDNATWSSTATITQSGGTASGSLYCRIKSTTAAGSYSGSIIGTSTGATSVNVAFSATVTSSSSDNWRTMTIPAANVANSDQTNFPVLVSGTLSYLATTGNGGKVNNSNGYDIRMTSDQAGTSLLAWDVESYNPVTGAIVFWVNIPSLSHTTDNVFYMHYGGTATTFQGNTSGTWNSAFQAVWHMKETLTASGQTVADVTSNASNMTSVGSWTSGQQSAGKIGGSLQMILGSADYFTFAQKTFTGNFTIELWANITVADNTTTEWYNQGASLFNLNFFSTNARLFNGVASSDMVVDGTSTSVNTWTHLAVTRSGTTLTFYHNGVSTGTGTSSVTVLLNALGAALGTTTSTQKVDEGRMSNVARSADWMTDSYFTQNAPLTFLTIGSEH